MSYCTKHAENCKFTPTAQWAKLGKFPQQNAHIPDSYDAKPLEAEMPISTNAFQPNELMSAHGTFISDWTQRIYWVSVERKESDQGLKRSGTKR